MKNQKIWSTTEARVVKSNLDLKTTEIASKLGRSTGSVNAFLRRNKIIKKHAMSNVDAAGVMDIN